MSQKTVIFIAHPNLQQSRLNKALINSVKEAFLSNVIIKDLYAEYGNLKFTDSINPSADQKLIEDADRIILQFPFHWYSSTPLLRKWIDDIFTFGWAYGVENLKTKGKKLYLAITTGGEAKAYHPSGYNNYFVTDFFNPFVQTAKLCQMQFAGEFLTQGARVITDEQLNLKAKEYVKFVKGE